MEPKFSCEDAIILVLEEHGESSTSFICGRVDFKRETVYLNLRKMKAKGLVADTEIPEWSGMTRKWSPLPRARDFHRPSKKWRLTDVPSADERHSSNV